MVQLLYQILLIFGVPWFAQKAISFGWSRLSRRKQTPSADSARPIQIVPKRSLINRATSFLWLMACVFFAAHAYSSQPTNIFIKTDTPYNAPNYLFRNNFREYCDEQRDLGEEFDAPDPDIVLPRSSRRAKLRDDEYFLEDLGYSQYDYDFSLFEMLKSSTNRHIYLTFGERTFAGCDWCKDKQDFMMFHIPGLLLQYGIVLFVVVASTSIPLNQRVNFMWTTGFLMALMSSEMSMGMLPIEYVNELLPEGRFIPVDWYFHMIRNGTFAFIFLSLWMNSTSTKVPEEENMRRALVEEANFIRRLEAVRMQATAIVEQEDLTDKFASYHKENSAGRILRGKTGSEVAGKDDVAKVTLVAEEASRLIAESMKYRQNRV